MCTSLELFLNEVVWSDKSDFRQLFLADYVYLNGRLAKFYGSNLPGDADSTSPTSPRCRSMPQRAGVLTHPYLMASFGVHNKDSSPILRGVFLSVGHSGGFRSSVAGKGLLPWPPNCADAHH